MPCWHGRIPGIEYVSDAWSATANHMLSLMIACLLQAGAAVGDGVGGAIQALGTSMERAGRDLAIALGSGLLALSMAWVITAWVAR
jgi:hypothetical protein